MYHVGVGDVLEIRLTGESTNTPTPYTVLPGGFLEYPLLGVPIHVAGKSADQIAAHVESELRRRASVTDPRVVVNVREYASHTVIVSGLVAEPGVKVIRREAVPLYVIVASAQPLPAAGRVSITLYATGQTIHMALDDTAAMSVLVRPGDVIAVSGKPRQYYYISGDVSNPGQKEFHLGVTLTQAIVAAGGELHVAKGGTRAKALAVLSAGVLSPSVRRVVTVSRQGAGGLLVTTTYDLLDIVSGKVSDPEVQPGDRIEVRR